MILSKADKKGGRGEVRLYISVVQEIVNGNGLHENDRRGDGTVQGRKDGDVGEGKVAGDKVEKDPLFLNALNEEIRVVRIENGEDQPRRTVSRTKVDPWQGIGNALSEKVKGKDWLQKKMLPDLIHGVITGETDTGVPCEKERGIAIEGFSLQGRERRGQGGGGRGRHERGGTPFVRKMRRRSMAPGVIPRSERA